MSDFSAGLVSPEPCGRMEGYLDLSLGPSGAGSAGAGRAPWVLDVITCLPGVAFSFVATVSCVGIFWNLSFNDLRGLKCLLVFFLFTITIVEN